MLSSSLGLFAPLQQQSSVVIIENVWERWGDSRFLYVYHYKQHWWHSWESSHFWLSSMNLSFRYETTMMMTMWRAPNNGRNGTYPATEWCCCTAAMRVRRSQTRVEMMRNEWTRRERGNSRLSVAIQLNNSFVVRFDDIKLLLSIAKRRFSLCVHNCWKLMSIFYQKW